MLKREYESSLLFCMAFAVVTGAGGWSKRSPGGTMGTTFITDYGSQLSNIKQDLWQKRFFGRPVEL